MTKALARAIILGTAALPAGAIATIITGDLRYLGVGLVLMVTAFYAGKVAVAAAQQRKAAEAEAADNARKLIADLIKRAEAGE